MITAAMLKLIEQAGEAVLVLVDGLVEDEFRRSRLTRAEVLRQLALMGQTLGALPEAAQAAMPEVDWAGWQAVQRACTADDNGPDDTAWFAARALVPATVSWLRVYQRSTPALFRFTA